MYCKTRILDRKLRCDTAYFEPCKPCISRVESSKQFEESFCVQIAWVKTYNFVLLEDSGIFTNSRLRNFCCEVCLLAPWLALPCVIWNNIHCVFLFGAVCLLMKYHSVKIKLHWIFPSSQKLMESSTNPILLMLTRFFCRLTKSLQCFFLWSEVSSDSPTPGIRDQKVWSITECRDVLEHSLRTLAADLNKRGQGGMLVWDKVCI